jgi:hypothetical protein
MIKNFFSFTLITLLLVGISITIAGCAEHKSNNGDTTLPTYSTTGKFVSTPSPTTITQSPLENPEPQRIFYSTRPAEYPNSWLSSRMDLYGSDMPWKDPHTVIFAYIEGSKGGITQEFYVPYGLWMINISVMANRNPTEVWFRTALCYASNGTIIDGGEMLNGGTMYKIIETSNTDMYLIIDTHNINSYRINFETTREYYNQVRNLGLNTDITRY